MDIRHHYGLCSFQLRSTTRRWCYCFIPRIGDYDKWAIKWGIPIFLKQKCKRRKSILNEMTKEVKTAVCVWYRTSPYDPRYQTEDIGDNAMKASTYGIKKI
jgi:hypothetical protein